MIEQDVSARLNPALIELQRDVLRSGHPLRIKLFGNSMYPLIKAGDVALIRPVEWTDLRRGDVVFYERESRLVAHRVMVPPVDGDSPLVAKGDTLENFDPPVRPEQLMGRVEALERGNRVVSLRSRKYLLLHSVAAELSGPYSTLFWKVAALRRRTLRSALSLKAYRKRRRATCPAEAVIRPYRLADVDALANCLWDLQPRLNFARMRDWTADQIERLNRDGVSVWTVDDGRRLVGVALIHPPQGKTVWITDLYLHPLARGFGWGERLLAHLETEAAVSGRVSHLRIVLPNESTGARKLLLKRGWQPVKSPVKEIPLSTFLPKIEAGSEVWERPIEASENQEVLMEVETGRKG